MNKVLRSRHFRGLLSGGMALVLVHGGGPRGSGTLTKLRKLATVTEVKSESIKPWELPKFVVAEARARNARIDSEAAAALVQAVGEDLRMLASAVEQLISDFAGARIGEAQVAQYFGGRAEVMRRLSPEGPVYQAGTLAGNPIATTAGLATLRLATDEVYAHIGAAAETVKAGIADAFAAAGLAHVIQSAGTMFSVFLTEEPVTDFDGARRTDEQAYAALFHSMLDQGVYLPPSAYEAWFLSAAHDERAVQQIIDALPAAARAAAAVQGEKK